MDKRTVKDWIRDVRAHAAKLRAQSQAWVESADKWDGLADATCAIYGLRSNGQSPKTVLDSEPSVKPRCVPSRKQKHSKGGAKKGRARNAATLDAALLELFKGVRRGLTATQVTMAVRRAGYKTRSGLTNFRTTVCHALTKLKKAGKVVKNGAGWTVKT